MNNFFEILKAILYFFIGSGILAFLIRSIIKLWLDKDIEKFKNDLKKELHIHTKLHEERLNVIKEINKKIFYAFSSLESLIAPLQLASEPTREVKFADFKKKFDDFSLYFEENKIFFNKSLSDKISHLKEEYYKIWSAWHEATGLNKIIQVPDITKWGAVWEKIKKDTPLLRDDIENHFREILGVNK